MRKFHAFTIPLAVGVLRYRLELINNGKTIRRSHRFLTDLMSFMHTNCQLLEITLTLYSALKQMLLGIIFSILDSFKLSPHAMMKSPTMISTDQTCWQYNLCILPIVFKLKLNTEIHLYTAMRVYLWKRA